ncbi:uncharacterized protein LOC135383797 [Ornithodoros turicata]
MIQGMLEPIRLPEGQVAVDVPDIPGGRVYTCAYCAKQFSTSGNLSKHRRKVHKVIGQSSVSTKELRCLEDECTFSTNRRDDLRDHLTLAHTIEMIDVREKFTSMAEFRQWLDDLSVDEKSQFTTRSCSAERRARVHRYLCNRSGVSVPKQERRRRIKSQGSCKAGNCCTAYLTAREALVTGVVTVSGCLTHYGHDKDVEHLRISSSDRNTIISYLQSGLPVDKILENVRGEYPTRAEDLRRSHLITAADIRNIANAEGIRLWRLHDDESESVKKLVHRLDESEQSPILLFKPSGVPSGPDLPRIIEDDFILVMQTPEQREQLLTFGAEVICVHAVPGAHSCKYTLITLLVSNSAGDGAPVAWCLTTADITSSIFTFYQAIAQNVAILQPQCLLSDDSKVYYTAWLEVFGTEHAPQRRLCEWHVKKVWNEQLAFLVPTQSTRDHIKKALDVLYQQTSRDAFQMLMNGLLRELKGERGTVAFGNYLETNFVSRAELWANCYVTTANATMNLDTFDRFLRHYFLTKANKRVDKLVYTLLTASKTNHLESVLEPVKGPLTKEKALITQAHQNGLLIPSDCIIQVDSEKWTVRCGSLTYEVTCVNGCQGKCRRICEQCNVCVHKFACSCPSRYMCKHIHACIIKAIYGATSDETLGHPAMGAVTSTEEILIIEPVTEHMQEEIVEEEPVTNFELDITSTRRMELIQVLQELNEASANVWELLCTTDVQLPIDVDEQIARLRVSGEHLRSFHAQNSAATSVTYMDHDYTFGAS